MCMFSFKLTDFIGVRMEVVNDNNVSIHITKRGVLFNNLLEKDLRSH